METKLGDQVDDMVTEPPLDFDGSYVGEGLGDGLDGILSGSNGS